MATYEIKSVKLNSLYKNLLVIFAIVGSIIGIFTFFIFPTDIARNLTFGARFLSWLIFVVLYAILLVAGIFVMSFFYNMIVKKLGGVKIDIDQVD